MKTWRHDRRQSRQRRAIPRRAPRPGARCRNRRGRAPCRIGGSRAAEEPGGIATASEPTCDCWRRRTASRCALTSLKNTRTRALDRGCSRERRRARASRRTRAPADSVPTTVSGRRPTTMWKTRCPGARRRTDARRDGSAAAETGPAEQDTPAASCVSGWSCESVTSSAAPSPGRFGFRCARCRPRCRPASDLEQVDLGLDVFPFRHAQLVLEVLRQRRVLEALDRLRHLRRDRDVERPRAALVARPAQPAA